MTVLLLIRHGHTATAGRTLTGWSPGVHLSEVGRREAERLVERLSGIPIAAIYSSPLERCRETAAPLARDRGVAARIRRGLIETGYGELTGRTIRQVSRTRLWRTLRRSPSAIRFPGGESLREVQARAVETVLEISALHPRATVAVFTHADVVQMTLAHFAGAHLDVYGRFAAEPASIAAIAVDDGVARILKVNDTGDLSGLATARRRRGPPRRVGG